jgi:hypothetical protein
VNSGPFDSSALAAFSLLPILAFLIWMAFVLGMTIFAVVMVLRFVKAHERIAKNLEALSSLQLNIPPPKDEP